MQDFPGQKLLIVGILYCVIFKGNLFKLFFVFTEDPGPGSSDPLFPVRNIGVTNKLMLLSLNLRVIIAFYQVCSSFGGYIYPEEQRISL
jgi:hypothetical protein